MQWPDEQYYCLRDERWESNITAYKREVLPSSLRSESRSTLVQFKIKWQFERGAWKSSSSGDGEEIFRVGRTSQWLGRRRWEVERPSAMVLDRWTQPCRTTHWDNAERWRGASLRVPEGGGGATPELIQEHLKRMNYFSPRTPKRNRKKLNLPKHNTLLCVCQEKVEPSEA